MWEQDEDTLPSPPPPDNDNSNIANARRALLAIRDGPPFPKHIIPHEFVVYLRERTHTPAIRASMAAVVVIRAGLGGQFILERAKSSMMACALRLIGFQTQQSVQSVRNSPTELDRCHACRSHVTSRWNIRDLHGPYAKELIDNYVDDRTCSGKRRPAPFDKPRDSIDAKVVDITRQRYEHLAHTEGALICWTCASPIANQLRYEALRSEQEAATSDTDMDTNTENIRSHLIRTCNIPDDTIPDVINHDAIAHIRKCVRQIIVNKPHECGLSRHPAPYIQPTRVPFGYGDLVGNSFEYRSTRTARIYLIAPSLEYIKNDHDAHTTYTSTQLRIYYRTVPDMQHPTPTYGSIALPEYLLSHDTTTRADNPTVITEPPHIDYTRNMWPISDRAHDIELLRQYHRIAHIICQRFQTNPDEGGRRTAKRILSDGYSGLCHSSNTHHNIYKRISLIAHPDKNVTRDTFHCALAHLVMESIQKAFDITTSLTTNADSRQAFQLIPTLDSERFHTLVHSYRRPTLTRSVSDPSIKTTNKSDNTLTETPTRHNAVSSPLRRFTTMPPPSTTGCTPLTPGPNTYAINSLRRTFNPISATNLFPDETPDTDRAGSTTEPAYFSDIDEDDPSPHDDEPPSMDDDVPIIRVATDTRGVDTGHTAPAPHTDITIGDTNNPTDTHGVMPTGPNDDTHVTNSNTDDGPPSMEEHPCPQRR